MAKTYRGEVRNGVIVLDEDTPSLPEGLKVQIEPADSTEALGDLSARLRRLAGRAEGLPEDLAENLDYYLHGHPKQ